MKGFLVKSIWVAGSKQAHIWGKHWKLCCQMAEGIFCKIAHYVRYVFLAIIVGCGV